MQKAVSPLSIQITAAILRTLHMYLPNVFVTLMSENICEGGAPTFLPNRARSGLNLALALLFRTTVYIVYGVDNKNGVFEI